MPDPLHDRMPGESPVGRKPRVTDDEIIDVFQRAETPVLTTTMAADELPIGNRGLLDRLKRLEADGRLEGMDVGPRGRVWWVPDEAEADEPDYLKSFGKYEGTNIAESVDAVGERFDRDMREGRDELSGQ